jgi:hypothetical protein
MYRSLYQEMSSLPLDSDGPALRPGTRPSSATRGLFHRSMAGDRFVTRRFFRGLVIGLVFSLSIFNAALQGLAAAQGAHHVHHAKATHASVLCSLICAANQVYQVSEAVRVTTQYVTGITESRHSYPPPPPALFAPSSRAPPPASFLPVG